MTYRIASYAAGIERFEQPESSEQVAELLATAAEDQNPVRIVGGEGAPALGNRLRPVGWSLSTTRLNRILEYQPTDMTLSVEAGARLSDVSAALAEHGQMLPIEAADPERASIGGLLATGLAGPRRYGGGTLRDVLIGIAVAYPDGSVAKAGGMVVKNVSGFDMMRIHHGAMGTLGVIVSANFKVLPMPRSEFTVRVTYPDWASVAGASSRLRDPGVRPVALVVRRVDDYWEIAARYEGRDAGLHALRLRLADHMPPESRYLEASDSSSHWTGFMTGRRMDRHDEVRLRLSAPPSMVEELSQSIYEAAQQGHMVSRFEIEPGLGMITLSLDLGGASSEQSVRLLVHQLRTSNPGSVVTVLAAPDTIKAELDVWGLETETIDIMRSLKREFDPAGILNPGCFVGFI